MGDDRLAGIKADHLDFHDKNGVTCDVHCDDWWLISEVERLRDRTVGLRDDDNHCAGCPTCMGGGP